MRPPLPPRRRFVLAARSRLVRGQQSDEIVIAIAALWSSYARSVGHREISLRSVPQCVVSILDARNRAEELELGLEHESAKGSRKLLGALARICGLKGGKRLTGSERLRNVAYLSCKGV